MESTAPLFGPNASIDDIDDCLGDGWARYRAVAYALLGLEKVWMAAIYELADTFERYEKAGRDNTLLYRAFYLLAARTRGLPNKESARQLFQVVFAYFVEETKLDIHLSPAAAQRARDREWLDDYWAKAVAEGRRQAHS